MNYIPFILTINDTEAMCVHADGTVSINWTLLQAYADVSPLGDQDMLKSENPPEDFQTRYWAHAMLSVRDGTATEFN
jgi:hypothetical protein